MNPEPNPKSCILRAANHMPQPNLPHPTKKDRQSASQSQIPGTGQALSLDTPERTHQAQAPSPARLQRTKQTKGQARPPSKQTKGQQTKGQAKRTGTGKEDRAPLPRTQRAQALFPRRPRRDTLEKGQASRQVFPEHRPFPHASCRILDPTRSAGPKRCLLPTAGGGHFKKGRPKKGQALPSRTAPTKGQARSPL